MKILWACGHEMFAEDQKLLMELLNSKGHSIELVEKFYGKGVVQEVSGIKDYDVLILYEYLDRNSFIIETLEGIRDNYSNLNIIYIIADNHKDDNYAKNLISIGVSNVLYVNDLNANNLCDLIFNPRGRTEGKVYLGIMGAAVGTQIAENISVSPEQIQSIILYLEKEVEAADRYNLYADITTSFSENENLYILKCFSEEMLLSLKEHPIVALYREKLKEEESQIKNTQQHGDRGILGNILNGRQSKKSVKEVQNIVVDRIVQVGFKKLVLTVWDNAEFGCELAYVAARMTDYNVMLIDLDLMAPKTDMILNVPKYPSNVKSQGIFSDSGLNILLDALEKNIYVPELLYEASVRRKDLNNLYVLTGNYNCNNYELYSRKSLIQLIERSYQNFEITILLVNKSVYDEFSFVGCWQSDYNIIPIRADLDQIREFNSYLVFYEQKHQIPLKKSKFVAFDYKEGFNLDIKILNEITESNYIGKVKYSKFRARYRNLKAAYVNRMEREVLNDYIDILSQFNIVAKRMLADKIKNQITTQLIAIKRKIKRLAKRKRSELNASN